MKRLSLSLVLRPVSFFSLVVLLATLLVVSVRLIGQVLAVLLLLTSLLIPCWHAMINRVERHMNLNTLDFHSKLVSEIDEKVKFLHPINSSATNLARVLLASSLNGSADQLSFSEIETTVAPVLFQALSTVTYVSQVSYIGLEGLFFSYYTEGNQTFALYSNSSFSFDRGDPNARKKYISYIQSVNQETGKLYGKAIESPPMSMTNTSWFQAVLNSSTHGYASVETGWNNAGDLLFLNSARINGGGVISLGFLVEALTAIFTGTDPQDGGSLYLATKDGKVLIDQGLQNTHMVLDSNMVSIQLMKPNGDQISRVGNVSCNLIDGKPGASILNIQEKEYMFYCLPLDIVGVQSVYVLGFPQNGLVRLVHKNKKVALLLLILMIATMVVAIINFVLIIIRASKREMHLCAALIKQMESTQQAERKSMNKSLAFASASHDVRCSLAGITGLIELCFPEAPPASELHTNLRQMDTCAKELLRILNSILDTSKIEAGKMQLEEEEFDLAQLLEDVVDLYHPIGIKKGVDVVLDPYDGSIMKLMKFSQVKGDRGKLKQILCNLLSNAVKFTFEGHVTVRGWVRKPSLQNSIIASKKNCLPCLFYKNSQAYNDLEAMNAAQQDPNALDLVFEVDDTGKGIPKEKQKSVFENYVQVKETALGQGGTGLGLGIVQSLVRLMHGDIGIVDKEIGEKGTCFRFNVLLNICENISSDTAKAEAHDIEEGFTHQMTISAPNPALCIRTPSPKLATHCPSPKQKSSHVVLWIENNERRRTSQRFMEKLGIKVSVVKELENLPFILRRIKYKHFSGKSELSSPNEYLSRSPSSNSVSVEMDMPLSTMVGSDYTLSVFKRTTLRCTSSFILIVIDANAGNFPELRKTLAEFRKGLQNTCCRVVWLKKPTMCSISFECVEEDMMDPNDVIMSKPFHGSRLYEVVELLPEYEGTLLGNRGRQKRESLPHAEKMPRDLPSSSGTRPYAENSQIVEIQDHSSSGTETLGKKVISATQNLSHVRSPLPPKEPKIQEFGNLSNEKFLSGRKILVAEDTLLLRKVIVSSLVALGATVEYSENGQEALHLVCNGLIDQRKHGSSNNLPYDYILMDCEMPVMDGYEATKKIREVEKDYGVHIPIIALTGHDTSSAEAKRTIEAGMDVHLVKPLKREHLFEAIKCIDSKRQYA